MALPRLEVNLGETPYSEDILTLNAFFGELEKKEMAIVIRTRYSDEDRFTPPCVSDGNGIYCSMAEIMVYVINTYEGFREIWDLLESGS